MPDKVDGYLYCYAAWPFYINESGERIMYSFDDAVKLASTFNAKVATKVLTSFVGPGTVIHNNIPEARSDSDNEPQISSILDKVEIG